MSFLSSGSLTAGAGSWLLLQTGLRAAADNMAADEWLLDVAASLGQPVLRFYGWSEPAATFGYFQKFDVLAQRTSLRPLVRRPTGGGLVPHDSDWTYSFVCPPAHPWWSLTARESYAQLHGWLREAFSLLNVRTSLAADPRSGPATECFIAPEQNDLLCGENKIAGAAQRRNRRGLLIQGSVQPPTPRPAILDWQDAMCDVARSQWRVQWAPLKLSPAQETRIAELVVSKYGREEYNRKR